MEEISSLIKEKMEQAYIPLQPSQHPRLDPGAPHLFSSQQMAMQVHLCLLGFQLLNPTNSSPNKNNNTKCQRLDISQPKAERMGERCFLSFKNHEHFHLDCHKTPTYNVPCQSSISDAYSKTRQMAHIPINLLISFLSMQTTALSSLHVEINN